MSLQSKGNFKINNIEYAPRSLKVGFESLAASDSGRTDDGVMRINWIYRRIRKLEIEMPPLTSSQFTDLLLAVQGKEYNITYFDPLENAEKTIYVYTSTSAAECYSGVLHNGLWQGVAFNAIEIAGE